MLELMSQEALRLGAERRREVALETMRDARRAESLRHATGVALVAMGRRVAGELSSEPASPAMAAAATVAPGPALATPRLQTSGDCI
jgi:hypothetical protein